MAKHQATDIRTGSRRQLLKAIAFPAFGAWLALAPMAAQAAPGFGADQRSYTVAAVSEAELRQMVNTLVQAIDQDDKDGVIKIMSRGFPADFATSDGTTLLMHAAKQGKTNAMAALLAADANPNLIAKNGATAMMLASNQGHLMAVNMLLHQKGDPNLRGPGAPTPMHLAVIGNHVDVIKLLAQGGADLGLTDDNGLIPLELAFLAHKAQALAVLQPLYRLEDKHVSMFWTQEHLYGALYAKDSNKVLRLLAMGFDPNAPRSKEDVSLPLEIAINEGDLASMTYLLAAGADPNRHISGSGFPIWWLSMNADARHKQGPELLKALLEAGARPNDQRADGVTALSFAKSNPNPEYARILAAAGAK